MKHFRKSTLFLGFILFVQMTFAQFTIPPKPTLQTSVYDYAQILDAAQKTRLEKKLIGYADSTSTQIVIITIKSLKGESIGILTPRWAHKWGIGNAKKDNGVLILLAEKERKIWISPGYGAEIKLTAGITGTIVRNIIIPEFKKGDYYAGFNKGVDAIFKVLKGTFKNTQTKKRKQAKNNGKLPLKAIIIIVLFVFIIISKISRGGGRGNSRGGRRSTGADILTAILLSGAGRSHGSFGGSSGGGFGSGGFGGGFGGGGFSGGGAGGGW